jgi:hypothetical protein
MDFAVPGSTQAQPMDDHAPGRRSAPYTPEPSAPEGRYANFFKIGHTSCEFLLEFGQLFAGDREPASALHSRIVTGPPYAKALLRTLERSVQQFEAEFGPIQDLEEET